VDAGVGAAGALGEDTFADGAVDGVGEEPLDGGERWLDLPSVEGCAVVGEDELPVRHALSCHGNTGRREVSMARCRLPAADDRGRTEGWLSAGLKTLGLVYLGFVEMQDA
jgi:hypothetical protein